MDPSTQVVHLLQLLDRVDLGEALLCHVEMRERLVELGFRHTGGGALVQLQFALGNQQLCLCLADAVAML